MKEVNEEAKNTRRTLDDVDQRAQEIRNRRRELGIDPLAPKYTLHQRNQQSGWRYFWAINKENRIFQLQEVGYQIDPSVEPVSAGNNSDGLKHIRMMIPESIYKEDFARKMKLIDDTEKAMSKADIKGGLEQKEVAEGSHISIGRKTIKLGSTQG